MYDNHFSPVLVIVMDIALVPGELSEQFEMYYESHQRVAVQPTTRTRLL